MPLLIYSKALPTEPSVPTAPWTETFTGINGSAPDSNYWQAPVGNAEIQNNKLRASTPGTNYVRLNYNISGDFSIQTDWDVISHTGTNWGAILNVTMDTSSNRMQVFLSNGFIHVSWWIGGVFDEDLVGTGAESGKFRITRSGSNWNGSYDVGSGWVDPSGSKAIGSLDCTDINIMAQEWGSASVTADFDNFTINSGVFVIK